MMLMAYGGADNTYYVSSTTGASSDHSSNNLSYYISNADHYFASDTTFVFMEGEHVLDKPGVFQLIVSSVSNLTLTTPSTNTSAVIRCGMHTRGLAFISSQSVSVLGIALRNCGMINDLTRHVLAGSLFFGDVHTVLIAHTQIYNDSGIAVTVINAASLIMYQNAISHNLDGAYLETVCSVNISRCNFSDNAWRGLDINYGAASCRHTATSLIIIVNSSFINNSFNGVRINISTVNEAMVVYMHHSYVVSNGINNASFGGMFLYATSSDVLITDCAFLNNDGLGGLHIWVVQNESRVVLQRNVFYGNVEHGHGGAGLRLLSWSNRLTSFINQCSFVNNVAHAISYLSVGGGLHVGCAITDCADDIVIANSIFSNNTASSGGGIFIKNIRIRLINVTIIDNRISGIYAINSKVTISAGLSTFANNTAKYGGGLRLDDSSYLETEEQGSIVFANNVASTYGGAIFSSYSINRVSITEIDYGACTISNINAVFVNNTADMAGDNMYNGRFYYCGNDTTYGEVSFAHNVIACPAVPSVLKYTSLHSLSPISSDPLAVCFCTENAVDCFNRSMSVDIYPGQEVLVELATVGMCGGTTPGLVNVRNQVVALEVKSDLKANSNRKACKFYSLKPKYHSYHTRANITIGTFLSILTATESFITMHYTILPCPQGLVLDSGATSCICDNATSQIQMQVKCNVAWLPHPIQRTGRCWLAFHKEYNCTIVHDGCPFDYCITSPIRIALNESNLQCNNNRSGILCGQCQPGLSLMLGSNKCTHCENTVYVTILSIIGMALAGVILVVLLIVLNLTVSVGTINGVLFYANVVKLNESVLLSQHRTPVITQFIAWLNLDLGIEYCFVDGLDSYVKTWLQFVFPLYLWFLVITIIIACRYSFKLSRMCGRNAVPVLATLILMSYTKLLRTITNSLMLSQIQCGDKTWQVWNIDGNIQYLGGKHLALFIVSILFLITGLIYTGLVFSSQWLQRYSGKCCKSTRDPVVQLKPLIDAYTGPFKDKYRFWTGLCLIVRLLFTIIFSFTSAFQSKLNNFVIFFSVFIISFFGSRAYKDVHINICEMISFTNLVMLSILVSVLDHNNLYGKVYIVSTLSVSIEMTLLFAVFIKHFFQVLRSCSYLKQCCYKKKISYSLRHPTNDDEDDDDSVPVVKLAMREPLIFD